MRVLGDATLPTLEQANPVARASGALAGAADLIGAPPPGRTATLVTGVAIGYLLRGVLGAAVGFVLASWAAKAPAAPSATKATTTGS